jgi:hypothetical protein
LTRFPAAPAAGGGQTFAVVGFPGVDAFVGPHQRFGPVGGREFDDGCGVEVDQPFLFDRDVEGMAGGGADVPQRRRVHRPPPLHPRPQFRIAAAGLTDEVVVFLEGVEHVGEVRDPQDLHRHVPEIGLEVQPYVAGVPLTSAVADAFLAFEPDVEPVAEQDLPVDVQPGADLPAHRVRVGQRPSLLHGLHDQVSDLGADTGSVDIDSSSRAWPSSASAPSWATKPPRRRGFRRLPSGAGGSSSW